MHRAPLGKVTGQRPPLATGAQQIEHCAEHLIQINTAWARTLAGTLQQGTDGFKLLGANVAGVLGSHGARSLASVTVSLLSVPHREKILNRFLEDCSQRFPRVCPWHRGRRARRAHWQALRRTQQHTTEGILSMNEGTPFATPQAASGRSQWHPHGGAHRLAQSLAKTICADRAGRVDSSSPSSRT